MGGWLTKQVGGAPNWLLVVLLPVAVVIAAVLVVPALLPSAAPDPASSTAAPQSPSVTPTAAAPGDRLLVLGDSYAEGYAAEPATRGFAYLVGETLGWETEVDGVSGTGFTYGGSDGATGDYGSRIRARIAASSFVPDVVVLEGSQNDYRAVDRITSEVVEDVRLLQDAYPDARIVLFGPAAPQPLQSQLGPIDAADQAAADELGIPYISPYQGDWFTEENSEQYGAPDGAHLDTEGHAYLAERFLEELEPLLEG